MDEIILEPEPKKLDA